MKRFTYFLLTATLLAISSLWSVIQAETLTVADGSNTNEFVPLYGNWADAYQHVQVIYPATDLTAMNGKQITGMKFYISSTSSVTKVWNGTYKIRLAETSDTYFSGSAFASVTSDPVYSGSLDGTTKEVTITFTSAYSYGGGNLLFDLKDETSSDNYNAAKFLGVGQSSNTAVQGYNSSSLASVTATARQFIPKTTFTYQAAANPNCADVAGLTKGDVTATTAAFTWTDATVDEWQYVCLPAATAVDWSDGTKVQTTTSNSVNVTGLSGSTDYKFYVRANCGSSNGVSRASSVDFKTPCGAKSIPYEYGFEDVSYSYGVYTMPGCWEASPSGGNYPSVYGGNAKSGTNSFVMKGSSASLAILPPMAQALNTLSISFFYYNIYQQSGSGQLEVGYITNNDPATYTKIGESFAKLSAYAEDATEVSLSSVSPAATNLAFKYPGSSFSSYDGVYIDDVTVSVASSCTKPTGLSAEAVSATSASVGWTAGGSETSWNLQYSTDQSSWTAVNGVTDNPYTLTSLSGNTTYYVQVQADCSGSQSGWTSSAEVTTPCAAVIGVGWSQNFNDETAGSGEIPACWKKIGSSYPYVSSSSYYRRGSSGNCLYFYGGRSTSEQIAILPEFTEIANESKTLQITLWYSNYSSTYTGSSYASPEIGYITDPTDASTFEAIETLAKVSSYTEATVELPSVPAGACVAIRYGGGSSDGYLCVDDISVSEAPSCLKPTGVAGSATAYNQASISWTENGSASAWKLQYSSDNGENWSDEIAVTTNPYTLTDLSSNTLYVVRVKANCGGSTSAWSAKSAAFMTPCGLADGSNYTMGFETSEGVTDGTGKLPGCWEYLDPAATNPYVYNSSSSAYEGSNSLYFYGGTSSTVRTVILPEMNRDINTLSIEFYYKSPKSDYSTYPRFTLGYIAADGTTFEQIETLDYASDYTHYKKALTSAADDASRIAIRYSGSSSPSASAYIDNIHVFVTPSCVEPTTVAAANITANSADISWTEGGSETAWKLQYSTDGSNWIDANGGNTITANPYTLNGLSANTTYYARVKAICGGSDVSEWSSASAAFRTECATITELPWNEDFEAFTANTIPTCWDNSGSTSTNSSSENYYVWGVHSVSGNKLIRMCNYYVKPSGGSIALINTPSIELPSSPAYELAFDYTHNSTGGAMIVKVSTDNGSSWTNLQTFSKGSGSSYSDPGTMTEAAISLADYAGETIKLQFYAPANYGDGAIFVDNVSVRQPITCPKPTAVTVSSVTAHTASVSWTNGGSETAWKIQTSTDGTNWSAEIAANANPFTLTGLEANTTYYARVKADCGGGDESEWSAKSSAFDTPCEAKAIGWSENFDAQSSLPTCWNNATYSGTQWSVGSYDEYHSASYSARYNGRTYSSYSADLVTPQVTISSDAVLEFWYKNAVTAEVYINDGTTTTKLWDIASASNWTKKTISLSDYSGKTVSFIFRGHGYSTTTTKYLYVDDVRVLRNVTLSDNADNTATLASLSGQTVYATIGRTLVCADYYNTLCLPFNLPTLAGTPLADGELWAFKYAHVVNGELLIRIVETESIKAGEPYLIVFPAGENIVNPLFENVTISASAGLNMGDADEVQFRGLLSPEAFAAHDQKKLFVATENKLYWWDGDTDSQLNGFRAYFYVNVGGDAVHSPLRHGMPARIVKELNTATGINNVQNNTQCIKLLENDQLVIIRNGVKYNVQGQKIQ